MEPGVINVYLKLKGGVYIAALPKKFTDKVYKLLKRTYPSIIKAKNILQTTLQNANPVIHPSITLLNTALIERTKDDFYFYEDGVTNGVGRLIEGVDNERIEIGRKLGLEIIPDPVLGIQQGYMQEATYDRGYSEAKGFKGIKAQSSMDYRYINEDVGYGLVFMAELGKKTGVDTPIMDSVIEIASVIMKRDFRKEKKRTLESLGLDKYSLSELEEVL